MKLPSTASLKSSAASSAFQEPSANERRPSNGTLASHTHCQLCGKPRPLMTVDEVAAYLKLTVRCVYEMVSKAKSKVKPEKNPIPFLKIGAALRFNFDEIVEWTKRG